MCGIIGFTKKNCIDDIYNGLKLLEYRGYDSVGVAFFDGDSIEIVKEKGRVESIYDAIKGKYADVGIGHTRWATHGIPSKANAHPHACGHFTIVHNGIIENSDELKKSLLQKGYTFLSQTDTEVIAILLEEYFDKNDVLRGIKVATDKLSGSFALAILNKTTPDTIYLAKKDTPLVIGKGDNFFCFASDSPALIDHTSLLYKMKDGEFASVTQSKVELFDANLQRKEILFEKTSLTKDNVDKGSYPNFMLKEIYEIPKALNNTLTHLQKIKLPRHLYNSEFNHIVLIGCGTAFHACIYGKELLLKKLDCYVEAITSSEFIFSRSKIDKNSLVIAVSQSGETADTITGIKKAKRNGSFVLAITNVPSSSVITLSDYAICTKAGVEIGVAATKSYATQLIALRYLAYSLANVKAKYKSLPNKNTVNLPAVNTTHLSIKNTKSVPSDNTTGMSTDNKADLITDNKADLTTDNTIASKIIYCNSISNQAKRMLKYDKYIKKFVEKEFDNIFFLGIGVDYQSALEGALKVKEIAYMNCDAYPSGEIKHGPLALVDNKTLVVVVITKGIYLKNCINAINEVQSRGATVLTISNYKKISTHQITLPDCKEDERGVLSAIPLDLLAYHLAVKKGLDPDKPRNLAKSVTVH